MKFYRILLFIIGITSAALLYVQQQVDLTVISYRIRDKKMRLSNLVEQNNILMYNNLVLKSPQRLEKRLAANDVDLEIPYAWQVVKVTQRGISTEELKRPTLLSRTKTILFNLFALNVEAEARTQK